VQNGFHYEYSCGFEARVNIHVGKILAKSVPVGKTPVGNVLAENALLMRAVRKNYLIAKKRVKDCVGFLAVLVSSALYAGSEAECCVGCVGMCVVP
jgi:hypothetical protein